MVVFAYIYISVLGLYTVVFNVQEKILLKISTRRNSRIESVPLLKLKRLASAGHRFWRLDGDFLVLESY